MVGPIGFDHLAPRAATGSLPALECYPHCSKQLLPSIQQSSTDGQAGILSTGVTPAGVSNGNQRISQIPTTQIVQHSEVELMSGLRPRVQQLVQADSQHDKIRA